MPTDLMTYLPPAALLLLLLASLFLIWRYQSRGASIESYAELQQKLRSGRPTLLQFYAPL